VALPTSIRQAGATAPDLLSSKGSTYRKALCANPSGRAAANGRLLQPPAFGACIQCYIKVGGKVIGRAPSRVTAPWAPLWQGITPNGRYELRQDWHDDLNVTRGAARSRLDMQHGFVRHIVSPPAASGPPLFVELGYATVVCEIVMWFMLPPHYLISFT